VKVLSVEGNRIKLSRKAILKEQRAKMGGEGEAAAAPAASATAAAPRSMEGAAATFEGGFDGEGDAEGDENFNHEGTPNEAPRHDSRPGGGADRRRRRRRRVPRN